MKLDEMYLLIYRVESNKLNVLEAEQTRVMATLFEKAANRELQLEQLPHIE